MEKIILSVVPKTYGTGHFRLMQNKKNKIKPRDWNYVILGKMVFFLLIIFSGIGYAQLDELHGDVLNRARNIHAGNLIRVTYYNHGMLGAIKDDNSLIYAGEWPINSGKIQVGNASSFVGTELVLFDHTDDQSGDSVFVTVTPAVFCQGWDPDVFSHDSLGTFLGFEPLSGFFNVDNPDQLRKSAMSQMPITWPIYWPDKMSDVKDAGWEGKWNGYFGKNVFNADQESYHVLDDYQFTKRVNNISLPKPVPGESTRGGLGLRKYIRGLQWSNPDAEDCIFWIYSVENFGELNLRKTNFGLNVGASMGGLISGSGQEYLDDAATFYRESGLTVNYDYDNIGAGGYTPVPWVGFAFLESPGNAIDGIDNDGDGIDGEGDLITKTDFTRFVAVGEEIVLIDYNSSEYTRTISTMPDSGISFKFNNQVYHKAPNQPLFEIPRNGIDDNLNGIIDESDGATIQIPGTTDSVSYYLYIRDDVNNKKDYLAKNYITGSGLNNLMIDERRDDGIDNDGDWDPLNDDVGLDGAEGTGDPGEGDGVPTPGVNGLPGENNIDKVDVSESDQIGLTSFIFYEYGNVTYSDDKQMWDVTRPGYFDGQLENVDADYIFSTGYFPLQPGQTEAFSVGMVYGWDEADILRNKDVVQAIYDANYNFAVAPIPPKLTAVAGNNKVTLYWTDESEYSKDRYLGDYDFEGYKIYRATDPSFSDAGSITDGYGTSRYVVPIAIFDKIDSVSGFFPLTGGTGVQYQLGHETGIVHSYVDSPLINGRRYFYAVCAYDQGAQESNITPSENNKQITVNADGEITTGINTAVAIPTAPSPGYIPPDFDLQPQRIGGNVLTHAIVRFSIIDPDIATDGKKYEVRFLDITMDGRDNDLDGLFDLADVDESLPTKTSGFVILDKTDSSNPVTVDTVWIKDSRRVSVTIPTDSGAIKVDKVRQVVNLYNDNDQNSRTFTYAFNGLEMYVYNPSPGILNWTFEDKPDIKGGIRWSGSIDPDSTYKLDFGLLHVAGLDSGVFSPRQYMIVFEDAVVDTAQELKILRPALGNYKTIKARESNFHVYDAKTSQEVPYAFVENYSGILESYSYAPPNHFSAKDEIYFFENINGQQVPTFHLSVTSSNDSTDFINYYNRTLGNGDTLYLFTESPLTNRDGYEFALKSSSEDLTKAKEGLDDIKVVPNPYVVTNDYEPQNPYANGRGPRKVYFINLPDRCTIRIFTIDGMLVDKFEHNDLNGSKGQEAWDLLTKDNLDVAYGLYIYHVEAPGLGSHIGKFILIK